MFQGGGTLSGDIHHIEIAAQGHIEELMTAADDANNGIFKAKACR